MKVLIGCEESQTICAAFRKVGIADAIVDQWGKLLENDKK